MNGSFLKTVALPFADKMRVTAPEDDADLPQARLNGNDYGAKV
jgi:hypothetical protein